MNYHHLVESFELGEVSFHKGWLYHRAGPNKSNSMRKVMTIIFMDKDIKSMTPINKNQQLDLETWCPEATIGFIADTPFNPIIFP